MCLFACFPGTILIVKPDFIFEIETNPNEKHNTYFFMFVVFAVFLKAIEDVIIGNVEKEENFLIILFMYSVMGMILFPIPIFLFNCIYPTIFF